MWCRLIFRCENWRTQIATSKTEMLQSVASIHHKNSQFRILL